MKEFGKRPSHIGSLDKARGPAPSGQSEDNPTKSLQALHLQEANKNKKQGGNKAIKDHKKNDQPTDASGGASSSWNNWNGEW